MKETQDDLARVQQDLLSSRKSADTLDGLYKSAVSDKQSAQQKVLINLCKLSLFMSYLQVQDLEEELDELRSRLKEIQEALERETLAKVDLQNQIQSLREDMAFKRKVYDEVFVVMRLQISFLLGNNYFKTYWIKSLL